MTPKKLSLQEFRYIYSKVPRLCVDLVIESSKGISLQIKVFDTFPEERF